MKSTTKGTFNQDIINAEKVVLLDVWAPWCAPCRGMEPVINAIHEETKDWAEVVKLDASTEMELVQELGVSGLPTFLVFKNGKLIESTSGAKSKDSLLSLMSKAA